MPKYRKPKQNPSTSRLLIGLVLFLMATITALVMYGIFSEPEPKVNPLPLPEPTAEPERIWHTTNEELVSAGGIPVIHEHIPWDYSRRPGEVREIHFITIHETDNRGSGSDSHAHNAWLTTDQNDVTSWHYTVDDHSIYHNIPDNEISWNAGDYRDKLGGNMNGIGIEMCVNESGDYEETMKNTAALVAELLHAYDLIPDDVRLHQDFMDKVCPHRMITEGRVEEFMQMVRDNYNND